MTYRFKRTALKGIGNFFIIPSEKPFLLTVEGARWSLLHFAFDVILFFICNHLLEAMANLSAKNRFIIVWGILEGVFLLLSFWIHRAKDIVIKLSETKIFSDADCKQHTKRRLRSTRKAFPAPQYSCDIIETTSRNFFWTHKVWLISVKDVSNLNVVQEFPVVKQDWYRYYDGPVTQLIE